MVFSAATLCVEDTMVFSDIICCYHVRRSLTLFSVCFLRVQESDLENYILELIPTLSQLRSLEKSFYSFYVCTAVRKFFFFLDPMRTGRIKIQEILACGFLDDLLEVRNWEESLGKRSRVEKRARGQGYNPVSDLKFGIK